MSHYQANSIDGMRSSWQRYTNTEGWQSGTAALPLFPVNNGKQNQVICNIITSSCPKPGCTRWPSASSSTWIQVLSQWKPWNEEQHSLKLTVLRECITFTSRPTDVLSLPHYCQTDTRSPQHTLGDIHFLDPQLQSVCSRFVCCSRSQWVIWISRKGNCWKSCLQNTKPGR